MGADEYHPISHNGSDSAAAGGIGYTVVGALDTILLMGLNVEYRRARAWIEHELTFDRDAEFNTFEVRSFFETPCVTRPEALHLAFVVQATTRVLGGLLSAHHHSGGDALFLKRARDLADRILPAFDTPSGLPLSMVNLQRRKGVPSKDNDGLVTTAEVSALQLEFRYLSELTGDDTYWKTAERVRF
jgi:mannosyl-oligosaccharide alpha-1,2-mannosidase